MSTKLHINISQGVLDVEGEESFVKAIYDDFRKESLQKFAANSFSAAEGLDTVDTHDADVTTTAPKPKQKKQTLAKGKLATTSKYKPKFNPNLNLSGLDELYDSLSPQYHFQKILLFASFLRDKLNITPCSADDIYSCYFALKSKTDIPTAFVQALRDTQNQKGYIVFDALDNITIPIAGENYLSKGFEKKKAGKK